jgi:hypothetical protein
VRAVVDALDVRVERRHDREGVRMERSLTC